MQILIYRPDIHFHPNVDPDLCYTSTGQTFREWQRDKDEAYHYKVELIKRKLSSKNKHYIEDYWR